MGASEASPPYNTRSAPLGGFGGESNMASSPRELAALRAKYVSRVPRKLPPHPSRIAELEQALFWDTFCTHKRFMPPRSGQRVAGIHRRCVKAECVSLRNELRTELAEEYWWQMNS